MKCHRLLLESPTWPRAISWQTLLACIAGVILSSTLAYAELPVEVPKTTAVLLAQERHGDIYWAAFRLLSLAIPLLVLFTRLGTRLRGICEHLSGHRSFWTVTLFACAYLVLAALIAMPFDFYAGYVQPHAAGHSDQSLLNWLKGDSVPLLVNLIAASLFIWIPYLLIARSPRRWWLYCALALFPVAFLALVAWPVWVDPLTITYKPLDDHPLEMRIDALAARCGIAHIPVLVGGNSTRVTGFGPTNRIILQSNLASVETPDQIVFTVGHELKHYIMHDAWKGLAIIAGCLLAGFCLTDRLGRAAIRRFSRRWGFSELSDPASLPLMLFLLTFLWLAFLPFFNLISRHIEHEADRFGLELTHQNHAAAMVFAGDVQRGDDAPDWDTFFLVFQATHPSPAQRIEFANIYKPWEQGKPLVYANVCKSE
ncbi:MAG: M48 family metalloprotease [Terriglobales bacterium]|jgi:Zn-dependent protease with chaperone function